MATRGLCAMEECGNPVHSRGWCNKHYKRWKTCGDPHGEIKATSKPCSIEGCDRKAVNWRGWCSPHYQRWSRHGDPLGGGPAQVAPGTLKAWIEDHLDWTLDECLIWPFAMAPGGYANVIDCDGEKIHPHRLICRLVQGEPPTTEHQAAHSCGRGKQGCVSPRHLRWATPLENSSEKWTHGTMARGQKSGSDLTDDEVLAIWARLEIGGQRTVAREFGVSRSIVQRIWTGMTWSWLTGASSDRVDSRRKSRRL